MFNIGLIELLVIFFFLVIFVKPEEIPKISKNIGLFYRKLYGYIYNLKYELTDFESEINEKKIKKRKRNEISRTSKRVKK